METGTHDKEIDGALYKITMLRAKEGRKLLLELKTILGPSIAELLRGANSEKLESVMDMDLEPVAGAVAELSQAVSPGKYQEVYDLFARNTQVVSGDVGSPDQTTFILSGIPDHFQGKFLTEFKWLAFCLQVNYSDFLSGLESMKSVVKSAAAVRVPQKSGSPLTSTGTSGESSPQNTTIQP